MSDDTVSLVIEGRDVTAPPTASIIQAYAASGGQLVSNVGCMGQGVCGSCRCMVRREGARDVTMELACETPVEAGMQVAFVSYFQPKRPHVYDLETLTDGWQILDAVDEVFPQAKNCRHCGGCDRACPRGLEVQKGVEYAVSGDVQAAKDVFSECIMCNLCTLACPERIRPNHLGLFVRRALAALTLRPVELMRRLRQIESGRLTVDVTAVDRPEDRP
ncbi:conserved hypothetical protein [uncultured Alphaproteobacteria bacterium]|jgi:succinate dehydrogenase/fumarate reductase-like Fe-S protein|uniref:Ferredoxin n=1 Tax=uncultured Alphaproteobacteria bacterium TaxID=91750 RepID=A0A212KKY0_9PROT|nr:conserved hypothetical protein [uncultured Alphaproteobacteria bacterium]